MMDIEVPEICSEYYKCTKPFSVIYLVFLLYTYATMHGQTRIKFAKTWFTCIYNAIGVSSVNYVYLLTRTREKQRETERDINIFTTRRKKGGGHFFCHVVVCLALCPFCFRLL